MIHTLYLASSKNILFLEIKIYPNKNNYSLRYTFETLTSKYIPRHIYYNLQLISKFYDCYVVSNQ